jgi:hypothetical protein
MPRNAVLWPGPVLSAGISAWLPRTIALNPELTHALIFLLPAHRLAPRHLQGVHGAGKTHLINEMEKTGIPVLHEGFIDMPSYSIEPQSLTLETTWVTRW